jgi:DNA-binding transcriptional regulator YhcF (GntR family)
VPTPYPKYDAVVAEYTKRIARGDLAEGDRIPSLQEIAQEFGISLTTADRVVVILKDRKLVRGRAGAARYVRVGAQERARRRLAEDAEDGEFD